MKITHRKRKLLLAAMTSGLLVLTPLAHSSYFMGQKQDTVTSVLACFAASKDQGVDFVFNDDNGCKKEIKEACKFKRKDGVYRLRAMSGVPAAACMPFRPFLI